MKQRKPMKRNTNEELAVALLEWVASFGIALSERPSETKILLSFHIFEEKSSDTFSA